MNVGKIFGYAITGMLISISLYNLIDNGYFTRWAKKADYDTLSDFQYYLSLTNEDSFENPPCDYSSPAFSIISNRPKNIETCVQNIIWYPEGDDHTIYVIDDKGDYWKWSHFSIMNLYNMFWIPVIGLLLGALIGFIAATQTAQHLQEDNNETS